MYCKKNNPLRFANVGEPVLVQPNLALTPSQMSQLVSKGSAISTQNLQGQYFDGLESEELGWQVPIGERRGIDMAEVWQAEKSSRKNVGRIVKLTRNQLNQQVANPTSA